MAPRSRRSYSPRLCLETLEKRLAPATFTVTNLLDSGAGSLRQAILNSNATPAVTDTINFQAGLTGTILLASTLGITDDVTITGPGASVISVSGQNTVRVFDVADLTAAAIGVNVSGLTVTAGRSTNTGAGFSVGDDNLILDRVVVSNCTSTGPGGGIGLYPNGQLTARNCTISGNAAGTSGGGIYFAQDGALVLENSTLSGNVAGGTNGGGGLYFYGAATGTGVLIRNSTFSGNTALSGGAIAFRTLSTPTFPVFIQNSTITGNTAATPSTTAGYGGGGIALTTANAASISVASTVVSGNTATNGRADIALPATATLGVSNSAIGASAGFTINGTNTGNLPFGTDLKLLPLANNGGAVQTVAFAADSPLVNAGSNPGNAATDARGAGFNRVENGAPDIGALESIRLTVTSLADTTAAGTLRSAVIAANATAGKPETIVFQGVAGTIDLLSPLVLTDSVTIAGPGASALTLNGRNLNRHFTITDGNSGLVFGVTISGLTLTAGRETGGTGGSIFSDEILTLDRVVVQNSTCTNAGGGVAVGTGGTLVVRDSTISGNSATRGGGVYFFNGGSLQMRGSTVSGNTASNTNGGGGVYFYGPVSAGEFGVHNCTIANNTAPSGGGFAFRNVTSSSALRITNSTVSGNTSTTTATTTGYGGGGIGLTTASAVTFTIESTVVTGNTATAANGRSDIAIPTSATVNVISSAVGDPDGFTLSGISGFNLPFGQALLLNPLADNGGPTRTMSFALASPLRDAGNNNAGLATDQRGGGFARVAGAAADIGAFELQVRTVTNTNDAGTGSLRQAILDANGTPGVAETIVFQTGLTGTIPLQSTLTITDGVTVTGPGSGVLTVSGQSAVRVFDINGPGVIGVTISDLTVANGRVSGVAEGNGGGIAVADEAVVLDRVVVRDNSAIGGSEGGGLYLGAGGSLTVRNATISGNSSSDDGGGLHVPNGGSLLLENSTVSGNVAGIRGSGVFFSGAVTAGGLTIRNSTIVNNTGTGGGVRLIFVTATTAPVLVQNSTITGNAGSGFDCGVSGTITIASSVLSGNQNGNDLIVFGVPTLNVTNSAIGGNAGFTINGTNAGNLPFGVALGLLPLANNGGPTQTVAFVANSPLLNAGANPANLTADQRGFARVAGTAADIGAFELGVRTVTNTANSGAGSLRQAILDANAAPGFEGIAFQAGVTGTITLGSTLTITDGVTIAGPGAGVLAVSGNNQVRPFTVDDGGVSAIAAALGGLTVTNGRATNANGGGLFTANESVTLDGVAVSNCTATGNGLNVGSGGGVAVGAGGSLTVRNSTLSGNAANNHGGGVYFYNGGSLLLESSTVSGNTAADASGGGGLYFFGTVAAGGVTIRNSTVANNTAPSGGGMALNSLNTTAAPVLIQNSTFTGNAATTTATAAGQGGGGIALTTANAATITIASTVVSGNTATAANGRSDIAIPNTATVNVSNSAIGDADGFTINGTNTGNLPIGTALGLGSLANNGGPTQTVAFAANSPLRNAGSNPAGLAFDQRGIGFPRVFGGAADIGAFELQSAAAPPRVTGFAVNAGQANSQQRSRVTSVTVTFDAQVTFAGTVAAAFQLSRIGGGPVGGFTATAAVVNNVTVVTLAGFSGAETNFGSLADGRYTLVVRANQVSAGGQQLDGDGNGQGGDDFTLAGTTANGLFRLFGDADGSGVVNAFDFGQFRPTFGSSTGQSAYRDFLDFDGNGTINAFDFGQFRPRFGANVP